VEARNLHVRRCDVGGCVEHAAQGDHLVVLAEGPHVDDDLVDSVAVGEIGD
jgi:hypothetical protein